MPGTARRRLALRSQVTHYQSILEVILAFIQYEKILNLLLDIFKSCERYNQPIGWNPQDRTECGV